MFVLELSKPTGHLPRRAARTAGMVGYLVCSRYDTVWHVMNVAVDDRLRRQGIATALHRAAVRRGRRRRASSTRSRCGPRTSAAIQLYERFGFRAAGRRRGYYHDNREDAVIMWRTAAADGGAPRGRAARA